jgi:hypothetical protein
MDLMRPVDHVKLTVANTGMGKSGEIPGKKKRIDKGPTF